MEMGFYVFFFLFLFRGFSAPFFKQRMLWKTEESKDLEKHLKEDATQTIRYFRRRGNDGESFNSYEWCVWKKKYFYWIRNLIDYARLSKYEKNWSLDKAINNLIEMKCTFIYENKLFLFDYIIEIVSSVTRKVIWN